MNESGYSEAARGSAEILSLREVLAVLRRSHWLILLTVLAGVAGTAWYLSTQAQLYRAGALIRLTDTRGSMAAGIIGDGRSTPAVAADPVLSEIMVLAGRGVLGSVVDREGLRIFDPSNGSLPGWIEHAYVTMPEEAGSSVRLSFEPDAWTIQTDQGTDRARYGQVATAGGVSLTVAHRPREEPVELFVIPRELAIDLVSANLSAYPREGTDGIDIVFTSPDSAAAVRTASAITEVFGAANLAAAQEQVVRRREFLEEQLNETTARLIDAQARLSAFRRGQQVYSSAEQFEAQQRAMLDLDLRRGDIEADLLTYQSLIDGIETGSGGDLTALASAPGIASNPVITQLYSQLVSYRGSRDSATTGRWASAPTHPDVERLDSLIASTETRLVEAARSYVRSLDAQLTQLEGLRSRGSTTMNVLPDAEAQEVRLLQEVESIRTLEQEIRIEHQRAAVEEAVAVGQVEIIALATRAFRVPVWRGPKLLLGGMIGLLFGGGIAFLREHLNSSLVRAEEVETALGTPSLAIIPRIDEASSVRGRLLALPPAGNGSPVAVVPRGNGTPATNGHAARNAHNGRQATGYQPAIEAYRTLRTNLLFSTGGGTLKCVVVTSAGPGEGKTVTVSHLGLAFANQGLRVLLVDGDLRRPDLANVFGLPHKPGLTEVLVGEARVRQAVRQAGIRDLHLIPSGARPQNASELLGGRRMETLIGKLRAEYDMVIIDTPPVLAATDATVLGTLADAALVVVKAGATDRRAAEGAVLQLERAGVRTVGAVINDPNQQVPKYGSYYTYAYYPEPART